MTIKEHWIQTYKPYVEKLSSVITITGIPLPVICYHLETNVYSVRPWDITIGYVAILFFVVITYLRYAIPAIQWRLYLDTEMKNSKDPDTPIPGLAKLDKKIMWVEVVRSGIIVFMYVLIGVNYILI